MRSRVERALEIAVLLGALATIPLTVLLEEGVRSAWVVAADWLVWTIFLVEYVAMIILSPGRWAYVRRARVSLAVVVLSFPLLPAILGLVRLARLARFLRLLRVIGVTARGVADLGIILGRQGVLYVGGITVFLVCAGGGGVALLEPKTVRGGFLDGVWWAVVTASTVGYGDIAPTTLWGRLIAVVLMLAGVGLISTLAASITAYFVGQEGSAQLRELAERTARMERLLNELIAHTRVRAETHPETLDGHAG